VQFILRHPVRTATVWLIAVSQAALRESWLNDMTTVLGALSEQNVGNNTRQVEAALKKHEAIATDIDARVRAE